MYYILKVFVFLYTRAFFVLHSYNKLTCKITVQGYPAPRCKNNLAPPLTKLLDLKRKRGGITNFFKAFSDEKFKIM